MGAKSTLVVAGIALCVGFSINSCSEPIPETRVVKVPQVRVVTKTVEVKSDPIPIPESCYKAFDLAQEISVPDSDMTGAAGAILAQMSDVERNALRDDFKAMNAALEKVRKNKELLGISSNKAAEVRQALATMVSLCKKDLGEQK